MRRPRTTGLYARSDGSLISVVTSHENRDGTRTLTIPADHTQNLKKNIDVLDEIPSEEESKPILLIPKTEEVDRVISSLEEEWDDPSTHGQKVLFKQAYADNKEKLQELVEKINGIPLEQIEVSRWSILYHELDMWYPQVSKELSFKW